MNRIHTAPCRRTVCDKKGEGEAYYSSTVPLPCAPLGHPLTWRPLGPGKQKLPSTGIVDLVERWPNCNNRESLMIKTRDDTGALASSIRKRAMDQILTPYLLSCRGLLLPLHAWVTCCTQSPVPPAEMAAHPLLRGRRAQVVNGMPCTAVC